MPFLLLVESSHGRNNDFKAFSFNSINFLLQTNFLKTQIGKYLNQICHHDTSIVNFSRDLKLIFFMCYKSYYAYQAPKFTSLTLQ